ncbi:MAG: DNA-3-methyladenine glycosylase I [Dehalococcoidia bacterium]
MAEVQRCEWAGNEPVMVRYHDEEWGVPEHDDRRLFEFLTLEGAQAGLSWRTILLRREGYRRAFHGWDLDRVASMTDADVERLLQDTGIIRHRGKIESTVTNARLALEIVDEWGSLDAYVWQFVDGVPVRNAWRSLAEVPPVAAAAQAMSKRMRKDGFRFVGATTLYAFMQAAGLVNDHTVDCFRHGEV